MRYSHPHHHAGFALAASSGQNAHLTVPRQNQGAFTQHTCTAGRHHWSKVRLLAASCISLRGCCTHHFLRYAHMSLQLFPCLRVRRGSTRQCGPAAAGTCPPSVAGCDRWLCQYKDQRQRTTPQQEARSHRAINAVHTKSRDPNNSSVHAATKKWQHKGARHRSRRTARPREHHANDKRRATSSTTNSEQHGRGCTRRAPGPTR
mmetsp:Transcript_79503/g.153704  ORF Transcript_79503/g.153704 Transcript_79503/m.153704 type:complete len:204 (+) Transcript_79503:32-643(+)